MRLFMEKKANGRLQALRLYQFYFVNAGGNYFFAVCLTAAAVVYSRLTDTILKAFHIRELPGSHI